MTEHDVAALTDLPDGGLTSVDVEDLKILLVRDGQTVQAIGAICPHAGGPLEQGIRNGDRIVCPWHKAAFCISTGALLDPPAVDGLPRYDVRIDAERVLVTLPPAEPAQPNPDPDQRTFVIIGAGAAGAVAAQTLRETGFNGRVIMLDKDNKLPYDRTVLSKYVLSGEPNAEKSPLQSESFYREHRIERRAAHVVALDSACNEIRCADGSTLKYDAALLATGAAPVRPDIPGATLDNVFLLRSAADADAIRAQAERSQRAVVLGASFIGMEVAASLRERGLDVTVVGKETGPFEKQLGAQIGNGFVGLHRKNGVTFRLGQEIKALEGHGEVQAVTLSNGERLEADLVVIGVGVRPVADYIHDFPLHPDGSITVDGHLRIFRDLYAAGDVARFPYRGWPTRVEHWRVAQQQGRIAALNMAGDGVVGKGVPYTGVPVFWTIQYMKRLDYIGHATKWDDIIVHGDLEKPEFLAYYVKNGLVVAAAGLDRDQDTAALIELFTERRAWKPDELGATPSERFRNPRPI
jgi:NADPH-dependent 2,4-dienoyl-CoA reductase/sulfur reductase-like enzyme/nitrite reductase/ring-hydroxylating ferredoxin subunit